MASDENVEVAPTERLLAARHDVVELHQCLVPSTEEEERQRAIVANVEQQRVVRRELFGSGCDELVELVQRFGASACEDQTARTGMTRCDDARCIGDVQHTPSRDDVVEDSERLIEPIGVRQGDPECLTARQQILVVARQHSRRRARPR